MKAIKTACIFILFLISSNFKAVALPLYVPISDTEAKNILLSIHKIPENKQKVEILLDLAYYYLSRAEESRPDLDSASTYISQATELAEKLNFTKGKLTGILFTGIWNREKKNEAKAVVIYKKVLAAAQKEKLYELEGRTWYEFAILQDKPARLSCYQKARLCYQKAGDKLRVNYMDILRDWAGEISVKNQYFPGNLQISPANIPAIKQSLAQTKSEKERLDLLLKLASIYIYRPGEEKIHIDSAVFLLEQAKQLSLKLKDKHSYNESLLLRASAYHDRNETNGSRAILKMLTDSSRIKLLVNLSDHYWFSAYKTPGKINVSYIDSSYLLNQQGLKESMRLKKPLYIKQNMDRLLRICDYRKRDSKTAPETIYTFITDNQQAAGYPSKAKIYSIFCGDYNNRGNFYKALYYAQLAEQNLNSRLSDDDKLSVYTNLLLLYKRRENYKKSLVFHDKIIDDAPVMGKKILIYSIVSSYAECLIAMKQPKAALNYIKQTYIKMPPDREEAFVYYHVALGHCYKALNQFDLAEKNYKEAIKFRERQRGYTTLLYNDLAALYASKKMFKEAGETFKDYEGKINASPTLIPFLSLKSQIDSAMGNYKSAYSLLSISKKLSDSVYAVSKDKHTQELEFQYQTQKKEADLRLKDDNIRFLNQSAELLKQTTQNQEAQLKEASLIALKNISDLKLKQKDIDLLNQKSKLQLSNMQKQEFQQKVAIGAAVMLLLLTLLLYRLYHLKRTGNKQLEIQQHKIELSNNKLRTLLEEKEWLLKEIHHRVKNNLHTVMSLLESQSAYLENDALEAVRNSQHRIFAMSLIHQKLYQTDDVKTINMAQYIPELINYLSDSFDTRSNIQFNLNIENIEFGVSEAVPLGLIINEAITNSLKYAFKNVPVGQISISLQETGPEIYELTMQDNGIGLPDDFELKNVKSLGIKLIKGLTGQLEADLRIENNKGTKITISSLSLHNLFIKSMQNDADLESVA